MFDILDRMFAALVEELMGLDDDSITERFRDLELQRRRLDAEMAAVVSVADERGVWRHDGHFNLKGWVRAQGNWSRREVVACGRTARLLNTVPGVGDALLAGYIGTAQVDGLARVRGNRRVGDRLGEVIDQLLGDAEQLSFDDFSVVLQRWVTIVDDDGALDTAEANHENRTVTIGAINNRVDLRASGGLPLVTADVLKIFTAFVEAEFAADVAERAQLHGADAPASLLARTDAQRRFDALVKIFTVAGANPQVSGVRVPVVTDRDGVIINMGRTRRCFTGSARLAAKLLATHCDHPGCVVNAAFAQVDHVHEYGDGGVTDQDNGAIECGGHNRAKHRLKLTSKRDPSGKRVHYRADGSPMIPVGRRLIPEPEPDPWELLRHGHGPDPLAHMPPPRHPDPRPDTHDRS